VNNGSRAQKAPSAKSKRYPEGSSGFLQKILDFMPKIGHDSTSATYILDLFMKGSLLTKLSRVSTSWLVPSVVAVQGFLVSSQAQVITLVNNNSTAQVDTASQSGMFNWFVDGHDYLAQQWFWYRVGSSGPESAINTISAPSITTPNAQTLYTRYNNGSYGVEVDYVLTGFAPGSGQSHVTESISITNGTAQPLNFHFFQYSDFDLGAADTVQLGKSLGGLFNEADQSGGGTLFSETDVTPGANHGEASLFPTTLNELNDGATTTLNDNAGPVGPGDATWALQWDFTIAPGSSVGISKQKILTVPEPSCVALVSAGLAICALGRRKKMA
jgi:hypothetical protein